MKEDGRFRFMGRMGMPAIIAAAAFTVMVFQPRVSSATSIGGTGSPTPPGQAVPGQTGGAGKSDTPARNAPGQPAVTTSPVPVVPAQKKPIQIEPALLDAVYQALLKTDVKAEEEEFKSALDEANKLYVNGHNDLWYYQHHAKSCANKQYTSEDQKKAGCLGTDTLNQCSTKLFNKCFGTYKNAPFLTYRMKMIESAARLDKALKAYTGKLKVIPEPK